MSVNLLNYVKPGVLFGDEVSKLYSYIHSIKIDLYIILTFIWNNTKSVSRLLNRLGCLYQIHQLGKWKRVNYQLLEL